MHVFLIPSWYPSTRNPLSGIFFKEEAQYLAELHPELSISVSLHGNGEFNLDPRMPAVLWNTLGRYARVKRFSETERLLNLFELNRPSLSWSPRLLGGNLRHLEEAHRLNFKHAMNRFGKPDLIHAHVTYPGGWIAQRLAEEFEVPYVIKEHMGPFPFTVPTFIKADGTLTKWIHVPLEQAAQTIVPSVALADRFVELGLRRPQVIPNMVDERFFLPRPAATQERFTYFTLCNLSVEKGIPDLLRSAALALRQVPDLLFRIGGQGEQVAYRRLAEELGISHAVEWLGPVSREAASRYFAECSAFIMASHLETFGMVYAEAIACGKPVIATRCGGPESIVNDGNGLLVEVGNIEEIAEAIVKMYREHGSYDSNEIRRDFLARFSREVVTGRIMQCYQEVLAR